MPILRKCPKFCCIRADRDFFPQRKLTSLVKVGVGGTVAFGVIGAWTGNEVFFEQYLLPLLNKMDPEISHRLAVFATKYHLIRSFKLEDPKNLVSFLFLFVQVFSQALMARWLSSQYFSATAVLSVRLSLAT